MCGVNRLYVLVTNTKANATLRVLLYLRYSYISFLFLIDVIFVILLML